MATSGLHFSLCTLADGDFPPQAKYAETAPYQSAKIRAIVASGVSQDPHTSKQCSGRDSVSNPKNNDRSTYRRHTCRKSSSLLLRSQLPHRLQAARRSPQKKNTWLFSPNPFRWNPPTPASTSNRTLTKPGRAVGPAFTGRDHRPYTHWGLVC